MISLIGLTLSAQETNNKAIELSYNGVPGVWMPMSLFDTYLDIGIKYQSLLKIIDEKNEIIKLYKDKEDLTDSIIRDQDLIISKQDKISSNQQTQLIWSKIGTYLNGSLAVLSTITTLLLYFRIVPTSP